MAKSKRVRKPVGKPKAGGEVADRSRKPANGGHTSRDAEVPKRSWFVRFGDDIVSFIRVIMVLVPLVVPASVAEHHANTPPNNDTDASARVLDV